MFIVTVISYANFHGMVPISPYVMFCKKRP